MNIKLHIINASGTLTPFVKDIEEIFPATIEKVTEVLPLDDVDIIVWDYPDRTIKQYAIGGRTMSPYIITISLDPTNPNLQPSFQKVFAQTIIHELHHAARFQTLGYRYEPRLEQSVREGLAEHFEMELTGKKPEVWDTALTEEQLKEFGDIAKTNKSIDDFYVSDWLFGNKDLNIPEWTGYSIGFYLVSEYLKRHPSEKPSQLYNKSAEEFIE